MRGAGDSPIGMVLTGGGARAAYQVGVLAAVMRILDPHRSTSFRNPFPIICGTSAGAINAVALACRANDPHFACERLCELWENLSTDLVYQADAPRLARTGARWLAMLALGWLMPGLRGRSPSFLLDNRPLEVLLRKNLDFHRLEDNLKKNILEAVAITATTYTTGEHVTFYQATKSIEPWTRSLRRAVACNIQVDHLMASSSIPLCFRRGPFWCRARPSGAATVRCVNSHHLARLFIWARGAYSLWVPAIATIFTPSMRRSTPPTRAWHK